jgi:hypothetical protein
MLAVVVVATSRRNCWYGSFWRRRTGNNGYYRGAGMEQMVGGVVAVVEGFPQAYGAGGAGGNGVVIIKIPSTKTATFSANVTETNSTAGGYTTYIVTQTTTTNETVTFS